MREFTADTWKEFRAQFQLANERLANEMAAAGEDVRRLMEELRDRLDSIQPHETEAGVMAWFDWLFSEVADQLFSGPLGSFEKLGPLRRTLSAMARHREEMSELTRRLPRMVAISGAELAEIIGPEARGRWRRAWFKRRKSPRPLLLQKAVEANLWGQIARRARIDAAFEQVLTQAGLHLLAAWQLYRRHQLTMTVALPAGSNRDDRALAEERKWWLGTATALSGRIESMVRSYRRSTEASPASLGQAVLRRTPRFSDRRQSQIVERWERDLSQWHRQHRAVLAAIDLDRELIAVARATNQATGQALESLRAERDQVAGEMGGAIAWLEARVEAQHEAQPEASPEASPEARQKQQHGQEEFPPPKASLLPAEQRARDWIGRVSLRVQECLPVEVETVQPLRAVVRSRRRWRQLRPRSVLLRALERGGMPAAEEGFREAESQHTAVIRDVEQARQVVAFGLEIERSEGKEGRSVRELQRESVANALVLLEHRREIQVDPRPAAEAGLCRAQALTLLETHTALEFGQLGLLALLTRQSVPRAARSLGLAGLGWVRAASQGLSRSAGKALEWVAWKLGWERAVNLRLEPLVERPRLSAVLEVQFKPRELPALYRRLFRLAPVEDRRFLVGREIEMNGLSRAFSLWQSRQNATVLVVGARGSGKTSLLNCASLVTFPGVPVVRGQFSERIRSPEQMAAFLRNLFQLPAGEDLEAALKGRRQVVMIEEFERTFLRSMNGFEALRGFLRLMAATSGSVLWILSMNRVSFRYLDAVIGLGRNFSHCINAMSVSPEHMADAILQRHALSGLRLRFAPLAPGDPRIRRLRRLVGLEQSPQQLFFDALYRQSEGLFRSAFELWLGSIERIEGSMVRMLQPLDPDYKRLEAELKTEDLFALQAILQHASLTVEEMVEVFGAGIEEARLRLDRLLALEILEPEPACPGLRVRPQAGRFVRDALNRQNLL